MQSALSVNDFIKAMAEAGIDGTFRATNGEVVIRGVIHPDGRIEKFRVQTAAESRAKIREMFK